MLVQPVLHLIAIRGWEAYTVFFSGRRKQFVCAGIANSLAEISYIERDVKKRVSVAGWILWPNPTWSTVGATMQEH